MAEPDWPPLTLDEINTVLAECDSSSRRPAADIEWRSPRPLSSTVRVRLDDGARLVVKRVPVALRDADALAEEHAFMDHLRTHGIPIPEVWSRTHGEFSYEFQVPGSGDDAYRGDFSWSPYRSTAHAATAGVMLARMHCAASGFDAPARPPRPLLSALCTDLFADVERHAAARPALGAFLAERDWRAELGPEVLSAVDLVGLEPLWTHNDWHATNLLWRGDSAVTLPSAGSTTHTGVGERAAGADAITAVFDFGLANRTTAVFDLAVAIERFAVDWIGLRDTGAARIHTDQLAAFLRGYAGIRPLAPRERAILPEIFPLVHVHYQLSEIDYFLSVLPHPNAGNAEIAYRDYFLGHLRWAQAAQGRDFLDLLRHIPC